MVYIEVPDMNDSLSEITLNGAEYLIRFTYNEYGDYWTFGLFYDNEEPIVESVKIVPNFPLQYFLHIEGMPEGIFGAITQSDRIGRYDFVEKNAEFVFIPLEELEE